MQDTVVPPGKGALTEEGMDPFVDLHAEIDRLRREKNAVILAHFYQDSEIQDLADFVGDSLELSRKAQATDAGIIVFCGVRFMGEAAKILNPSRTVLLPDAEAGCSLEDSCQPEDFRAFRDKHPGHLSITYINCSAAVKALSDIIVTSSNAEAIIRQIPEDQPILFAPDRYLGGYLNRITGRNMMLWPGTCIVHEQFSERELVKLKVHHPSALVVAHPECPEAILNLADHVGSTKSILNFTQTNKAEKFIIATEPHIIHQMQKAAPNKTFITAPGVDGDCDCANCPYMEKNTLEKIYLCMVNEAPYFQMDEALRLAALKPLQRMMDMSPPAVQTHQSSAA
ncbi:MAG TPA: quinolinate synthase NadA [Rhodospirillales bacterium]|nr:quinolinate synthase NadA [Rhodospirillales bacterium]